MTIDHKDRCAEFEYNARRALIDYRVLYGETAKALLCGHLAYCWLRELADKRAKFVVPDECREPGGAEFLFLDVPVHRSDDVDHDWIVASDRVPEPRITEASTPKTSTIPSYVPGKATLDAMFDALGLSVVVNPAGVTLRAHEDGVVRHDGNSLADMLNSDGTLRITNVGVPKLEDLGVFEIRNCTLSECEYDPATESDEVSFGVHWSRAVAEFEANAAKDAAAVAEAVKRINGVEYARSPVRDPEPPDTTPPPADAYRSFAATVHEVVEAQAPRVEVVTDFTADMCVAWLSCGGVEERVVLCHDCAEDEAAVTRLMTRDALDRMRVELGDRGMR